MHQPGPAKTSTSTQISDSGDPGPEMDLLECGLPGLAGIGPSGVPSCARGWYQADQRPASPGPEHSPVGVLSFLRMRPEVGAIEVGHVHYSPRLQGTRAATEAQYLLASHVLDELGYRRYEWKFDALNAASRTAAERLGFRYEGTFRQDKVAKGRNRDTAWFAITDGEWPDVRERLTRWLRPDNFDAQGRQLHSLHPSTHRRSRP